MPTQKPPKKTETLTVYHGTAGNAVDSFRRRRGPLKRSRAYAPKPHFSTTTNERIARTFAFRRTGTDDWIAGRFTGVVLEYTLRGVPGRDFDRMRDPSCMQDEAEIAVYSTGRLRLAAVWRCVNNEWVRHPEPAA